MIEKCELCRFYFGTTCKRFPSFQEKEPTEWCGEFQMAPTAYPEPPDSNAEAKSEGEAVGSA